MIKFSPNERWSVKQCMEHPWFKDLLAQDEYFCENYENNTKFDWSIDDFEPTKSLLQTKIYDLSLHFHPQLVDSSHSVSKSTLLNKNLNNMPQDKLNRPNDPQITHNQMHESIHDSNLIKNIDKSNSDSSQVQTN